MQLFSGWEYLLIDAANQFGMDKELFEDRIEWVTDNMDNLEEFASEADEQPLYEKAVMAIRKAQAGIPTGHMVGFDAVCSGMQIMSVLTGCVSGADATGLVDPDRRADAYTDCTRLMGKIMGTLLSNGRADVKQAVMTVLYGSKKEPKNLFGEDTPELNAFYKAMYQMAPGACELLQDLLDSWQSFALTHEWVLPDGFDARVKVMEKVEKRIEVDELDHATFTYEYYENAGSEHGLSNVANVVHSIDAYVLRSLIRRCNYDSDALVQALSFIEAELLERQLSPRGTPGFLKPGKAYYYMHQYQRSGMPDATIFPHINAQCVTDMTTEHLLALAKLGNSMVVHKPFPVVSIHDDFKCHPNNMNHLRQHYIDIFAEMADSRILDDILSQLHGEAGTFVKKSSNLSWKIRNSNYALS